MSGSATRVYVARLAGVPVFDPNGDQVGKVRDIVVSLLTGARPPRVLGLILEVPPKRRIFLPILRVHSFDAKQVVVSGLVNMRRFEKRASETLVMGELLDRTVRLKDSDTPVTIKDVAIESDRNRDWDITRLFVKKGPSGFRRRAETLVVPWDAVIGLQDSHEIQGADEFLGTQGDPWDTQWDMFLACCGAVTAQLLLARAQDRALARLPQGETDSHAGH